MKIALVHDYLCGIGGAERVFQYICEEFSEADIYTLSYNPLKTFSYFKTRQIHTTWLNKFVQSMDAFRLSFPVATYVMQGLDLSKYDIVLSSSATIAKYVSVPNGRHICYCYIPTRAIWDFDQYFDNNLTSKVFGLMLPYLKKRDHNIAQHVDSFIAISNFTKERIRQCYKKDAGIIYCPVDVNKFYSSKIKQNYYLIVSRLEYWKRVDYAIEAFNRLNLPLRIIGTGKEEQRLRSMAKSNIIFLGEVDDATLAHEYSEARAVIFTPYLEYGLIPLEANASGAPVICYGYGGIAETMIPADGDRAREEPPTAIFFYEQTADALIEAIEQFKKYRFENDSLMKHARKWSIESFKKKIRECVTHSTRNL
ncbi:MAG: glycosyltransferase [Sedimentisphaerales bacterium]